MKKQSKKELILAGATFTTFVMVLALGATLYYLKACEQRENYNPFWISAAILVIAVAIRCLFDRLMKKRGISLMED
jgi:cobalamin biosynthesis protein CobD/CbiB